MKKEKIVYNLLAIMVFVSALCLSVGLASATGKTPRIEDGGGDGFTGTQYKVGYSYPVDTNNYVALRVTGQLEHGWLVNVLDWSVMSDLSVFSHGNYYLSGTTYVNSDYQGYGSWYGSGIRWFEDTVSVYY